MEIELLKLIYGYSMSGKLADAKFIERVIEIVVTKKGLNDYVRNAKFTNKLEKYDDKVVCAAYNPFNREILIDYESSQIMMDIESYYDELFNSIEQVMFRNLMITQYILHEIEHARQNKQIDDKSDNSVEAKLVNAGFMIMQVLKNPQVIYGILKGKIPVSSLISYLLQNQEIYLQYYAFNPIERLAQVNSYMTIVKLLEPIKKYIPSLYEFKQASLIENMLNGYEDAWSQGTCPTEVYLYGTRQGHIWLGMDFYNRNVGQLMKNVRDKYNLERRLTLGLPINENEYTVYNEWLHSTNKFNA